MLVVGNGGHARAVAHLLSAAMVPVEKYRKRRDDPQYAVVGVGCSDMALRRAVFRRIGTRIGAPCSALFGAAVGDGTIIFPGVVLGTRVTVGHNVVIYSNSTVEHDSAIGDHAWLSPGVILCGNVTIKPRAFLGAGAIILPGVTIGEEAEIGAGLTIHDDVADGVVKYGRRD